MNKVILIGQYATGKTSIINRYIYDIFSYYSKPTIGATFFTKYIHHEGKKIKIDFWDTASSERYNAIQPMFFKNATIALIIYDVTNLGSFNHAFSMIDKLREELDDIDIVVIGNKIDLPRKVVKEDAETIITRRNVHYRECSACSNEGIKEIFNLVDALVIKRVTAQPQPETLSRVKLHGTVEEDCCVLF